MIDLLIKNAKIITHNHKQDNHVCNLWIQGGDIVYIGDAVTECQSEIDARNFFIVPGFINGHIHFGEYYLRGYSGKLSTMEYIELGELLYEKFNEKFNAIRESSINNVMYESIINGTLTLVGVRGWSNQREYPANTYYGYPIMLSSKLKEFSINFENKLEQIEKQYKIKCFLGIHSLLTVNEKILNDIAAYIHRTSNTKLSIHISETEDEVAYVYKKYGLSPIEVLNKYRLLSKNTLLVHCNYLSDNDIYLIKKNNVSVAVCHNSNLKLGNKPCDVKKLYDNSVNILIATDGPATSDSLSLLDAARTTALISGLEINDIFDMITINPAKYLGLNAGSIEVGNKADLLLYDINGLQITYPSSYINNLIYLPSNKPEIVLKEGKIIIESYKFIGWNVLEMLNEKNAMINEINNILLRE